MPGQGRRRLAAIMFTDIVGYSTIMQEDETRGRLVRERHKNIFEQCMNRYNGEIIQYFGDGTLSIFSSAVSAVECAVAMQKQLKTYPPVPLRIGIHLGDIHYDDTEVYGHGVNVAARIEPVCNPGGIFISDKVFDEIQNHPWLKAKTLGVFRFKNVDQDIELFAVQDSEVAFPTAEDIKYIREFSQKVNLSEVATKSDAIRRFTRRVKARRRRKIGRWAAVGLFALMAILALGRWYNLFQPAAFNEEGVSIAVLPFVNMSQDEENEYFSDGMTEDILTLLSRIEGLRVTSRTSIMQYKDTEKDTRQIARELNVNTLLEGSIRRDGDRVRITAQLIDAKDDSHIWANTYDEELTHIFDVQSQVANDIADQLELQLSPAIRKLFESKPGYNVVAYDFLLKGREEYKKYTAEHNEKAIGYFNHALEVDSNFAPAYAGLGDAYAQKAFHSGQDSLLLDSAIYYSGRAIELDSTLSDGYKAIGLAFHYKGEYDKAATQYRKAIALDPANDMATNNLAMIEREKGNLKDAAKWAHRTLELNKNVPKSAATIAELYMQIGDENEAEAIIDEGIEVNPDAPDLRMLKGTVNLRKGEYQEALKQAEEVIKMIPDAPMGYELKGDIYLQQNEWQKAHKYFVEAKNHVKSENIADDVRLETLAALAESRSRTREYTEEDWESILAKLDKLESKGGEYGQLALAIRAGIHAELGDTKAALEYFDKLQKSDWVDLQAAKQHPIFDNLKGTPEYNRILRDIEMRSDSIRREVRKVTKRENS